MIYATEQQVVVTSGIVVVVGLVALCIGIWWGIGRGWREAKEDAEWARQQAAARRVRPAIYQPPDWAREAAEQWQARDEQVYQAGDPRPQSMLQPCTFNPDPYPDPETVLMPSAMLSREEMSWTGEIQRMTAEFERDMERLLGGTDDKLKEITR